MNDMFGDLFNTKPKPPDETQEKGVQLRGHDHNGVHYVRVEDVVQLLATNGVLPKATRLLRQRCRK